ncbi:hypothetical protein [Mycobacterium sp. E3305]|uniref:hypothetical protein n=1 Tax=Mycobacterium sp. E3305 TaxID=1834145 RepID=UPI0012E72904|nr:hypothetical protein [Mycobacterium sp. E3305]
MRDGVVPDCLCTSHFRFEAVYVPSARAALFWNLEGVKTIHIYDSSAAVFPKPAAAHRQPVTWRRWPPGRR